MCICTVAIAGAVVLGSGVVAKCVKHKSNKEEKK